VRSGPEIEVIRVSPEGRVGEIGLVLLWTIVIIAIANGSRPVGNGVLAMLSGLDLLIALGVWRWAFVPYVALRKDDMVVQNWMFHEVVPYSSITSVRPTRGGLAVFTDDAYLAECTVSAVQKAPISQWSNARTRADDVAEAIMARVNAADQNAPAASPQS
jgi:hypothetical protein